MTEVEVLLVGGIRDGILIEEVDLDFLLDHVTEINIPVPRRVGSGLSPRQKYLPTDDPFVWVHDGEP